LSVNYFEFLELPQNLTVDPQDLEKRFYALSRKWHPDRFARAGVEKQQKALDASALLNDAYRILRQPVSRAEYFLSLHEARTGEEGTSDPSAEANKVPPELLEEVFELNMALEELKAGDTDSLPQLRDAQQRFKQMLSQADCDLEADFVAWDHTRAPEVLTRLRKLLNYRKYISNLVIETTKTLENYVSD
jgi:molecular chaperone HscB